MASVAQAREGVTARRLSLRGRLMLLRARSIDEHLRQLERTRRRLMRGDVDVLFLGDSSCQFVGPDDPDPASLPELVGRRLDGARVATIVGGGFGAHIYADVLRILGTLDERPKAVVLAMALRANTMTHVRKHPKYRYAALRESLAQIHTARRRIPWVGRGIPPPSLDDYAAFEALEVVTRWNGRMTIGEYRGRLSGIGPPPWSRDVEELVFDYFHGELLTPEHWGLQSATELGPHIRDYGVPTAMYWTAPPIDRGEQLFPGEFEAHVRGNLALFEAAVRQGGHELRLIDAGLEDGHFIDSRDGTEHYNLSGRQRLADAVASAIEIEAR